MFSTSAPAMRDHLLDLLARVRHHRQRAERERRVRRLVHDDVVRDLVDERLRARARRRRESPGAHARPFTLRMSTGPSPAPSSASPCRTASVGRARRAARGLARAAARARAARRASPSACSRRRASPRRRAARPGSRRGRGPSKRWSTASSPCPPVTIAAARAELDQALRELAPSTPSPASARASIRFGVTTVASGKSRATSAPTASSCEQLRARARDHHRVDDERHRVAARGTPATASITAREKSIPVFAASTPMSEKTASSCARHELGGSSCTAVTPTVFCAVSATIADMPYAPGGGERLQVGLDAGAAAAVGAGDRQCAWNASWHSLRRHDPDQVRRV